MHRALPVLLPLLALLLPALLAPGCCGRRACAPARVCEAPAPAPTRADATTQLRYEDVSDLGLRNGILVVRGTRAQLARIDAHLTGIRTALRHPERAAPPADSMPAPARADDGQRFLRYHDVKDVPRHEDVWILQGTPASLAAVEAHLAGLRAVLAEARPVELVPGPAAAPAARSSALVVVMIHAVADVVAALPTVERVGPEGTTTDTPQDLLLAILREELGAEAWDAAVIRFQGESNLVVKASKATQERVAGILDGLRAAQGG